MGRAIPLDTIPDANVAPEQVARIEVLKFEETQTSAEKGSKLMYNLTWQIAEPQEWSDVGSIERFVIGTNDDPDAEDLPAWRSRQATGFKTFLVSCGYPLAHIPDSNVLERDLPGIQFTALVTIEPAKDGYPEKNRLFKFYAPTEAPQIGGAAAAAAGPPRGTTQARPGQQQAPLQRPGPTANRAPAGPPAGARPVGRPPLTARPNPRQAVAEPQQAEEEAVAETRATPAATTTQRARRSPAKRAGAGPSPKLPKEPKAPAVPTRDCVLCEAPVAIPIGEYAAHIAWHEEQENAA